MRFLVCWAIWFQKRDRADEDRTDGRTPETGREPRRILRPLKLQTVAQFSFKKGAKFCAEPERRITLWKFPNLDNIVEVCQFGLFSPFISSTFVFLVFFAIFAYLTPINLNTSLVVM